MTARVIQTDKRAQRVVPTFHPESFAFIGTLVLELLGHRKTGKKRERVRQTDRQPDRQRDGQTN